MYRCYRFHKSAQKGFFQLTARIILARSTTLKSVGHRIYRLNFQYPHEKRLRNEPLSIAVIVLCVYTLYVPRFVITIAILAYYRFHWYLFQSRVALSRQNSKRQNATEQINRNKTEFKKTVVRSCNGTEAQFELPAP